MQTKSSIIIVAIVAVLGLLVYFSYQPILSSINLGLDLRGLRIVYRPRKTGKKVTDTIQKALVSCRVDSLS